MNIYAITAPENIPSLNKHLSNLGNVIGLTSGNPDIVSYTELFSDEGEKILAINPARLDWKLPNQVLDKIKNLKAICTSSAWTRFLDFDYCEKHKIAVTHTTGANSQSVAEYTIWMMLSLARQLPHQIKNHWKRDDNTSPTHIELAGKKLGVIGLGNVGSRVAALGCGIGMEVLYWNRSSKNVDYMKSSIDEILKQSDVVINCIEICPETQGMLNKDRLSQLKQTAFFISALGGMGWGVEDNQFLLDMVATNKLYGFAVENEHKGKWPTEFEGNVFCPTACAHFTKDSDQRVMNQWIKGILTYSSIDNIYRAI